MQIDQYGFDATSVYFQKRKLQPYKVEKTEDVMYVCFRNEPVCAIHRITKSDGVITIEWAYGAWADRAALTYIPINETRDV